MEFNYTKDKKNIVTLTMDMAEKSANLIDEDYFKSLLENIVKLENESDLKGVILTSAKKPFLQVQILKCYIVYEKLRRAMNL